MISISSNTVKRQRKQLFLQQCCLSSLAAYQPSDLFGDNCNVMPYSCLLGNLLSCHHLERLDGISPPDTGPLEFTIFSLSLLWWYHSSPRRVHYLVSHFNVYHQYACTRKTRKQTLCSLREIQGASLYLTSWLNLKYYPVLQAHPAIEKCPDLFVCHRLEVLPAALHPHKNIC